MPHISHFVYVIPPQLWFEYIYNLKCTQVALDVNMLRDIFMLRIKMETHDAYH